jgi:hypothetical protein
MLMAWTEEAAGGIVVQSINDEGQEAMAKRPAPPSATEEEVRALLERYRCPVPFHEVRTRFLGNVATPLMQALVEQKHAARQHRCADRLSHAAPASTTLLIRAAERGSTNADG